ncbi:FAD-dependent monooxygenase [Chryseobacterium polytrichastri]|uniref:2-polyprenyl-6-methoxyphenol hydroxylase n=1 Tax=Chryseobacterium polytrichastri TaxID=1302687 RepID=A0A1M7CSU9_9FLAO|nr:FAD-dependent monooxygenase [Chryseobacterium polytrichastri]SHL70250.1 2-polyprenyl-6-methoxyphenol hydroxylase [Chryseobacterium polytrichastri]
MESLKDNSVLISGASIAGLSTAYWMNRLGYNVTVVELANKPRTAGAAIDIKGLASDISKRMGIFEQLKANRLNVEKIEFKNADDISEGTIVVNEDPEASDDDIEIERDQFMHILFDELKKDVEFIFNNSITALNETQDNIQVSFKEGSQRAFDLVLGCDGIHSGVRRIWFGDETEYSHFLGAYFSITIANKLLIKQKTMQMYNVPDKAITLNAYKHKTDIIFCFFSEKEINYDYRDEDEQRKIILEQFEGQSWRTAELLEEVQNSEFFYFDKFCQIKMPSWTKGRVALIGDAGYCASPAAGMGASLSIIGAATLADALEKYDGNFTLAFQEYNKNLRPFIEEVQANAAVNITDNFIPRTEEAIRQRNTQTLSF